MIALIQPVTKTLVLCGKYTNQEEFFPNIQLFFLIASFGSIFSNNASTITVSNSSQAMVQTVNRAHGIDDLLEDIKEVYSVFLFII